MVQKLSEGKITEQDKTLITGLNKDGNMLRSPVFRSTIPYAYPLFKIHKLNRQQMEEKVIPPVRLVHATREGPIYRLEKWCSPYLTTSSRTYCKDEFLLDTPDLLNHIKLINSETRNNNMKSLLFTLDVISLYPSIRPEMALKALEDGLVNDHSLGGNMRDVLMEFTELILSNSFISFENGVYITKEGIPTGNCISRQIADFSMHWLIFKQLKDKLPLWHLITFWKRFIDDIIGRWAGTVRQFHLFVHSLNTFAAPYGIQFGDFQIGRSVNFLDVKLYLDEDDKIQYRLYKKETDARLYLKPTSFHPNHVFKSIIFSQMIRIIDRNSQDHTCVEDLQELKDDLMQSGHNENLMEKLEPLAVQRSIENKLNPVNKQINEGNQIVFSVKYFNDVDKLRNLLKELGPDIDSLIGNTNVTLALRKHQSIGNNVIKNRTLSSGSSDEEERLTQKCNHRGCKTCPLLFNKSDIIKVNGEEIGTFRL